MDYYCLLHEEAIALNGLGIKLQTVITHILDPWTYPKKQQNLTQSKADNLSHKPEPKFTGKNPSYWLGVDQPCLDKPNQPRSLIEVQKRIDVAAELQFPIGLAVIPDSQLVIIDFDLKNYRSEQELLDDVSKLETTNTSLRQTRIELTPGGGAHVWVMVDDLSEWSAPNGLKCQFSTETGGPHRGEILTGGSRICICAPTERYDGKYIFRNVDFAHTFCTVSTPRKFKESHPYCHHGDSS